MVTKRIFLGLQGVSLLRLNPRVLLLKMRINLAISSILNKCIQGGPKEALSPEGHVLQKLLACELPIPIFQRYFLLLTDRR